MAPVNCLSSSNRTLDWFELDKGFNDNMREGFKDDAINDLNNYIKKLKQGIRLYRYKYDKDKTLKRAYRVTKMINAWEKKYGKLIGG